MRNTLNKKSLTERPTGRALLALTLASSLAAFGCTTNRTPGNGEPIRSGPGVGPAAAPTSGVTSGSSSGSTGRQYKPMMSSSAHMDPLPTVTTRSKRLPLSPDEAAAVLAGNQFARGVRVLGPANPGPRRGYTDIAVATTPTAGPGIVTVNSSINSVAHVAAVSNGAASTSGGVATGLTGAVTVPGTTAGVVSAGTPAAAATGLTGTALTPTAAATPITPGTANLTTGTLNPTVASAGVPSPTITSSGALANGTVARNRTSGGTTANATTNGTTIGTTVASGSAGVRVPIRITQDSSGRVTVSNGTSTTGGRSQ